MKLHLPHLFLTHTTTSFTESGISSLTVRKKKILAVVSVALGLLAACIALWRYYSTKFSGEVKHIGSKNNGEKETAQLPNSAALATNVSDAVPIILQNVPEQSVQAEESDVDQGDIATKKSDDEPIKDSEEEIPNVPTGENEGQDQGIIDDQEIKEAEKLPDGPQPDVIEVKDQENEEEEEVEEEVVAQPAPLRYENGRRKKFDDTKTVCEGTLKDGQLDGKGKKTQQGSVYKGIVGYGDQEHALAKVEDGNFVNGQLHGQGVSKQHGYCPHKAHEFVIHSQGHFSNGKLSGSGKEGRKSVLKGFGREIVKEKFYEGNFREGKLHGPGKEIHSNDLVLEGNFKKGKLDGLGKITDSYFQSSLKIQKGTFKEGRLNGLGGMAFVNGTRIKGIFRKGYLHGKGKIIYPSGEEIKGVFKNGILNTLKDKLNGQGKIVYSANFYHSKAHPGKTYGVYEGQFKEGELDGEGKVYDFVTGKLEEGKFEKGKLVIGTITYSDGSVYRVNR